MSKTVSRLIHGFSELLMLPMKARRRWLAKARTIEGFYQDVTIDTDRGALRFHVTNRQTLTIPMELEIYEPDTLAWIRAFPEDAVLWDIGANIGVFSLYAAQRPGVRVVAFEPAAATYAVLIKNIEVNRMDDRVFAYCIALGDVTKLGALNMETTEAGAYLHVFDNTVNAYDETVRTQFTQSTLGFAVDEFIRHFRPPAPTHIKIDVDSTESQIISGAAGLLGGVGVKSVLIEALGSLDRDRNQRLIAQMADFGYQPQPIQSSEYRNLEFRKPGA